MSGIRKVNGQSGRIVTVTKVDNQKRYFFALSDGGAEPHYRTSAPFYDCKTWANAVEFAGRILEREYEAQG